MELMAKEESPGNPWKCAGGDYIVIRYQACPELVHPLIQGTHRPKVFDSGGGGTPK